MTGDCLSPGGNDPTDNTRMSREQAYQRAIPGQRQHADGVEGFEGVVFEDFLADLNPEFSFGRRKSGEILPRTEDRRRDDWGGAVDYQNVVAGKSSPREGRLARHDRVLLSDVVRRPLQTFPLTTLTSRTVQSLPSRISWLPSTVIIVSSLAQTLVFVANKWREQIADDAARAGLDLDGDGHSGREIDASCLRPPSESGRARRGRRRSTPGLSARCCLFPRLAVCRPTSSCGLSRVMAS